ncbi:MAG: N-acetylmuramoyl-L-alanine amidase-like domain-containing protein [Balneolaceae bacterium]
MKNISILLVLFLFLFDVQAQESGQTELVAGDDIVYSEQDVAIFSDIIQRYKAKKKESLGELIPEIGTYFLGNEYVAHTLEVTDKEKLIVNLREMDCTTYAENLLALARTLKSENTTFQQFTKELEKIRYRDGARGEYPTRLHYFSEWIYNKKDNNLAVTPVDSFGEPFPNKINFMSNHISSYKHLENNTEYVSLIAQQEKEISSKNYFYLPKNKIEANEHLLKEGDIVGITTNISGLDVAHVGVLVEQNGRMHLMHASQSKLKVEISDQPVAAYLQPVSTFTGIMIARPIN